MVDTNDHCYNIKYGLKTLYIMQNNYQYIDNAQRQWSMREYVNLLCNTFVLGKRMFDTNESIGIFSDKNVVEIKYFHTMKSITKKEMK